MEIVKHNTNKFYIYCYLDTRKPGKYIYNEYEFEYEPFYVGKGTGKRSECHLSCKDNMNGYKTNKINTIKKATGKNPIIIIIKDQLEELESYVLETKVIQSIGRIDMKTGPLTNLNDGGKGGMCRESLSPETRKKLSDSHIGNKSRLGIPHTEEMKKHFSNIRKGRQGTASERQRMIDYNKNKGKGYKLSAEHKNKISASCKGRIKSIEERQKLSKALKGRKISQKHRNSNSIAMKAKAPKYDFNGELLSIREASEKYNIKMSNIKNGINRGMTPTNTILYYKNT